MEHLKVLVKCMAIDSSLPALDWGTVLGPFLHTDVCG